MYWLLPVIFSCHPRIKWIWYISLYRFCQLYSLHSFIFSLSFWVSRPSSCGITRLLMLRLTLPYPISTLYLVQWVPFPCPQKLVGLSWLLRRIDITGTYLNFYLSYLLSSYLLSKSCLRNPIFFVNFWFSLQNFLEITFHFHIIINSLLA